MIGTLLEVAGYLFGGFIFSILVFNRLDGTVYDEKIEKYHLTWPVAIILTIFWAPIFLIGLAYEFWNDIKKRK